MHAFRGAGVDGVFAELGDEDAERDPGLEPGQGCTEAVMDAMAEREVTGRVAADVEAVRLVPPSFVAIGGSEEQESLASRGQGHPVQLDVARQHARERLGRGVEAQCLLDGRRNERRVGQEPRALVGKGGEPVDRVAEQLGGRLVARDQQQEAEAEHLGGGERPVTFLRGDERAHQIFTRCSATLGDHVTEVSVESSRPLNALPTQLCTALFAVQHCVGPRTELVLILTRDAEHHRDDGHRELAGKVVDHVDAGPGDEVRRELPGQIGDRRLEVGHPAGGEGPADQRPQLGVPGRVHLDEHRLDVLGPALKGDAPGGRERRPVVDGGPDVVMPRKRPEPPLGVEVRRRLVPELPVGRIGVFVVGVAVGIEANHGSDPNGTRRPVRGFRATLVLGLVVALGLLGSVGAAGATGRRTAAPAAMIPPDAGAVMPGIDPRLLGVPLLAGTGADASAELAAAQIRLAALRAEQTRLGARNDELTQRSLQLTAAERAAEATLQKTQAMVDRVAAAAYKGASDGLLAVLPSTDMLDLGRRMKLAGQAGTTLREISREAAATRRKASAAAKRAATEASTVQQRLAELAQEIPVAQRAVQARLGQAATDLPARKVTGLGIPVAALDAYLRAERAVAVLQPTCGLEWWLLAGIADGESGHGTHGGARADVHGDVFPPIIGIPLDGTHDTQAIADSDLGYYDLDPVWDHAVGAMQFTPGTWNRWRSDGNGDGKTDPQNLYDAALGAARKLCADAGPAGLHTDAQLSGALRPYTVTAALTRAKLTRARAYQAQGLPIAAPSVAGAIPPG